MSKSKNPNFYRTELDLSPENTNPDVQSDSILDAIARLMGFDSVKKQWAMLATDGNGRLRVTSGIPSIGSYLPKQITVTATETMILDANPNRNGFIVDNQSPSWFYLGLRAGDIATNFYIRFPNDMILEGDGYQGQLFGVIPYNNVSLQVLEY